jgi:isoleucyl-tRNA synthetase
MTHTKHYPEAGNNPKLPQVEADIIASWQKDGVFEKSVENTSADKPWVFYDGPPFANGLPHYGHLLTSYVKDLFARYHTMKGERVERRFGWDCHGLPAEMGAEKELGVSGRSAIEEYGIAKFNGHCRSSVMKYTGEWTDYINRAGRWVDFDNGYKTMDTSYMESVISGFKVLYEKGLVYESHRVMPYSWAAQTPLSNFETSMDDSYRERLDKAITVAFKLKDKPAVLADVKEDVYILAWTTTPWTLPSNLALAVSSDMSYGAEFSQERNCWEIRFDILPGKGDVEGAVPRRTGIVGSELIGLSYEPLFPYFADTPNAFRVIEGDFIEEGSGTGIVHLAPGFGEDDQRVCADNDIPVICPVDEAGCYTDAVFDIAGDTPLKLKGLNVIKQLTGICEDEPYSEKQLNANGLANLRIIHYLKLTGQLIKAEDYAHSYPHCWRTDEPLIYKAVPSWYVEVTKIKDRMVELNQNINWIPNHIKDGQFGKWLENARDWSISRNRFWGCPIPIWRTPSGKIKVFGSIAELESFFGESVPDLHRPFIDTLTKVDEESGETWTRVTDVFDCWFESGSMPFAQNHHMCSADDFGNDPFPAADFIVEYVGQTRGWFYTLMVLSTAIFDREPFKNVICHGVILGESVKDPVTGKMRKQKLSKKLKNYPDPNEMFDLHGSDAMRWRMIKEPVMHGGDLVIAGDGSDIRDVVRLNIKPIWNAYHFLTLYANTDGVKARLVENSDNLMDRYILAKLKHTVLAVEVAMDGFDTPVACQAVTDFFEVLNNWYIRRNRDRFWSSMGENDEDKYAAYNTLYTVLCTMCAAAAPLLPMTLEAIYQGLNEGAESLHLQRFPDVSAIADEACLLTDMDRVRDVCNAGLAIRDKENIRTRQPLDKVTIYGSKELDLSLEDFSDLIADELNVKQVAFSSELSAKASLKLTINFKVAGKRLGGKMKLVANAARQGDWKDANGVITSGGEILEDGEYTLQLESKDGSGSQAISSNDVLVVLDLNISDTLRAEGLARDVVRLIQQARKDADLQVTDRIVIQVAASGDVAAAIEGNKSYISDQTLADTIEFSAANDGSFIAQNTLEDTPITIGIKVA